jgi:polysaccharide pyruvyl transferase WcaK-like protein
MSGLNEFWEPGLAYKRWVAQQARQRVDLVVFSAQGLGPVQSSSARNELRDLLNLADVVTLRDQSYGANLLRELQVTRPGSRIVFDEAFSFAGASEATTREWLARAGLSNDEPFVAFHFRENDYTPNQRDPAARLGGLLKGMHSATGMKFLFVPMSYAEHSCVDVELGRRLSALLGRPEWYRVLPECRDAGILKGVVGRAKFSIALSYHVNVFSLTQGHPALILYTGAYYGLKSDGLIGFYGLPSQALDLDKAGDEQVVGAVREILSRYDRACADIAAVNERLKVANDWTLEEVCRRLDRDGAPLVRPAFRRDRRFAAP